MTKKKKKLKQRIEISASAIINSVATETMITGTNLVHINENVSHDNGKVYINERIEERIKTFDENNNFKILCEILHEKTRMIKLKKKSKK